MLALLQPASAQHRKEKLPPALFEHLHINVADKEASAEWYVEHVGLERLPTDNPEVVCVADKDHNFMIEFSSVPGIRNTYSDIDLNAFHLAFEGHETIEDVAAQMLAHGAVRLGEIYRNKVGDYVLNLQDPNGFSVQLIHRVDAFYPQPVKSTIRFEHFAFNTTNQMVSALWYVQFMDLSIPWSKDIKKDKGNYRNYRVPYIGDAEDRMSFELFGKDLACALNGLPHEVIHIGFTTDEPEKLAKRMIHGGARQAGEKQIRPNGDTVINLYDPRGVPLQLIKRRKPLI